MYSIVDYKYVSINLNQVLMGMPYGSMPRKTVPRAEQATAMDFSVLWDFEVRTKYSLTRVSRPQNILE